MCYESHSEVMEDDLELALDFATVNPDLGMWWDDREELSMRVARALLFENISPRRAVMEIQVRALGARFVST